MSDDLTVPLWLVKFDCGHVRHPDANGNLDDGPPPIGWAGFCVECSDLRTTVDVVTADPLDGGHTAAMWDAAQVIAEAHRAADGGGGT